MFWTRMQPARSASTMRSPFDLFNRYMSEAAQQISPTKFPAVNMWANEEGTVLTSELPGVKMEDLDISVSGKIITIKGQRPADEPGEKMVNVRSERVTGQFERAFQLPYAIDAAKVEASLKNGVLTVTLPRAESEKPRKITISA